jgi:hypothetical protein
MEDLIHFDNKGRDELIDKDKQFPVISGPRISLILIHWESHRSARLPWAKKILLRGLSRQRKL